MTGFEEEWRTQNRLSKIEVLSRKIKNLVKMGRFDDAQEQVDALTVLLNEWEGVRRQEVDSRISQDERDNGFDAFLSEALRGDVEVHSL